MTTPTLLGYIRCTGKGLAGCDSRRVLSGIHKATAICPSLPALSLCMTRPHATPPNYQDDLQPISQISGAPYQDRQPSTAFRR